MHVVFSNGVQFWSACCYCKLPGTALAEEERMSPAPVENPAVSTAFAIIVCVVFDVVVVRVVVFVFVCVCVFLSYQRYRPLITCDRQGCYVCHVRTFEQLTRIVHRRVSSYHQPCTRALGRQEETFVRMHEVLISGDYRLCGTCRCF